MWKKNAILCLFSRFGAPHLCIINPDKHNRRLMKPNQMKPESQSRSAFSFFENVNPVVVHYNHYRQITTMDPVLIEAACVLNPEDTQWQNICNLALEIGYPGKNGPILWKHIGWLQEQTPTTGKTFSHALWSKDATNPVFVFDFLPVIDPETADLEKTFRLRKTIFHTDGRRQIIQSGLQSGDYTDDLITLKIRYPELNNPLT